MDTEAQFEEQVRFTDEIGLLYEDLGHPRIWGRILGWLLLCQPEHQSAEDLSTALHASRGSISTTIRSLMRAGLVERQTVRGDRRTYFRIRPGAWMSVFEHQKQITTRLHQLAEQGLTLLQDESAERLRRVEELHDLTGFYELVFSTCEGGPTV